MAKINLLILFILLAGSIYGQGHKYAFLVEFTDKKQSVFSINNPRQYLSERAIARRAKFNIIIDESDFPVNQWYIDSIINMGGVYHCQSRWFNSAVFYSNSPLFAAELSDISFVKKTMLVYGSAVSKNNFKKINKTGKTNVTINAGLLYGGAANQLGISNGQYLHQKGFMGQNMHIAVFDGGFYRMDQIPAFDSLFNNNRILGTRDFVNGNHNALYLGNYHGMAVMSVLAANIPGLIVGSAPHASYWLLLTEDTGSESPVEEENWIAAAEFADSAGADLFTVSLGYSLFDNADLNHTYSQMDGKTTRITRGAGVAFSKGIIIVNSAGNEANNQWYHITAPSDGPNVLSIGAIDVNKNIANFSSRGPSADNRVKPDVVGVGMQTVLLNTKGEVSSGNGTSFSCPLVAGMVACLWQAFPNVKNSEIIDAVRQSSSNYNNPDNSFGYGIPDMAKAYSLLNQKNYNVFSNIDYFNVYPNPAIGIMNIEFYSALQQKITIKITSLTGQTIITKQINTYQGQLNNYVLNNIDNLPHGMYILSIITLNKTFNKKIVIGQ